jgi:glycosyltransferase involved in cell wall biosynthesis
MTIASVQCKTFLQIEIVAIEDGPIDLRTIALLNAIDDIRFARQQNAGLPAAIDTGFAASTGDFFLPLDSDDWLNQTPSRICYWL